MSRHFFKLTFFILWSVSLSLSVHAQDIGSEVQFERFSRETEFPNYFIPWEYRSDPESLPKEKQEEIIGAVEKAVASVLDRLSVPVMVGEPPELQNLALFPHLRTELEDRDVEILPSHGVVKMVVSYLYFQLRKKAQEDSVVDAVEFLKALSEDSRLISAFNIRGLGSDLDVHVRGGSAEDRSQAMRVIQDVIESADRHYEATQLRVDMRRTFFTIADPMLHDPHIELTTSQGGSDLDWISFQLAQDSGGFLLPEEHPEIVRELLIFGRYHYHPPREGVENRDLDKQTIRGIRGLIEFPFSQINDEQRIREEIQDIIRRLKNDQPVSFKIQRFFERITRNARFEGANNRFYRGEGGSLEALIHELMELYQEKTGLNVVPEYLDRFEGNKPEIPAELESLLLSADDFRDAHSDEGFLYHVVPDISLSPAVLRQGFFVSREGAQLPGDRVSHAAFGRGTYFFDNRNDARSRASGNEHAIIFKVPVSLSDQSRVLNLDTHSNHPEIERIRAEAKSLDRDFHTHLARRYGVDLVIRNNYILAQNSAVLGDVDLVELVNGYGGIASNPSLELESRIHARQYHSRLLPFAEALGLEGLERPIPMRELASEAINSGQAHIRLVIRYGLDWLNNAEITPEEFNTFVERQLIPKLGTDDSPYGAQGLLSEYLSKHPKGFGRVIELIEEKPTQGLAEILIGIPVSEENIASVQSVVDNPNIPFDFRVSLLDRLWIKNPEAELKAETLIGHMPPDDDGLRALMRELPAYQRRPSFDLDGPEPYNRMLKTLITGIRDQIQSAEPPRSAVERHRLELSLWASLTSSRDGLFGSREAPDEAKPSFSEADLSALVSSSQDLQTRAEALGFAFEQHWAKSISVSDIVDIVFSEVELPLRYSLGISIGWDLRDSLSNYQITEQQRNLFARRMKASGQSRDFDDYSMSEPPEVELYFMLASSLEDIEVLAELADPDLYQTHPLIAFMRYRSSDSISRGYSELSLEASEFIQTELEKLFEAETEQSQGKDAYRILVRHFPDSLVAQRELARRLKEGVPGAVEESQIVLRLAKNPIPELDDNLSSRFLSAEDDMEKKEALQIMGRREDYRLDDESFVHEIIQLGIRLTSLDIEHNKTQEGLSYRDRVMGTHRFDIIRVIEGAASVALSESDEEELVSLLNHESWEVRQYANQILVKAISNKALMGIWRRLKENEDLSYPDELAEVAIKATPAETLNIEMIDLAMSVVSEDPEQAVNLLYGPLVDAHRRLGHSPVAEEIERRLNPLVFGFLDNNEQREEESEGRDQMSAAFDMYGMRTTPVLVETVELMGRATHEPDFRRNGMNMDVLHHRLKDLAEDDESKEKRFLPRGRPEVREAAKRVMASLPKESGCANALQMAATRAWFESFKNGGDPWSDGEEE